LGEAAAVSGADLAAGIRVEDCPTGATIAGHVGDDPVLLSQFEDGWFAVGGSCTHYGGALAEGRIADGCAHCPLHHACFDLRTGATLRAPALDPVGRWEVAVENGKAFVRAKLDPLQLRPRAQTDALRIVIVGGGAAGLACANELRRLGHSGPITMLSADRDPPVDRPNLSKDFLAGNAPDEWMPLRSRDWYRDQRVDLRLETEVRAIDPDARTVTTAEGETFAYDRLLIATGCEPRRLPDPEFHADNVHVLRSFADARALAKQAEPGRRAVIVGSSFIALEAAAALRKRGVAVTISGPERVPFERVLGAEIGGFLQRLHEANGVRFHLGTVAAGFAGGEVTLADGERLSADFLLLGIGVQPRIALGEAAGLNTGDGLLVSDMLETSAPGIYAAGDIAAFPDPVTGEPTRIEHWVVAERQGQTVAANMLGHGKRFAAVPFFWTEQYGRSLRYVGHAAGWDEVKIDGEVGEGGFIARYFGGGRHLASAALNRDRDCLEDGHRLEQALSAS
jgi:NADPH-dependent 2,4-dienoyl-CoA reductase/sulfur reductase-like enzyme/nitrite reductase/ring-hydroxylating ferredoxin subunit